MSKRLVPTHFNQDGRPKRGYASEQVAKTEAARLGMTYYRCDFCDRFHLATKSDRGVGSPSPDRLRDA